MNTLFFIMLFIFWTMFGSFASVIIYRLKSWEAWIVNGRSHCKTCERNLSPLELFPIFSWLVQGWKCRWCREKISYIYPILEFTMWILFVAIGYFMIDIPSILGWDYKEIFRLFFFLALIFLTVIYVFYDILYLEIPESILLIANIWILGVLMWDMILAWILGTTPFVFPWMEYLNGWTLLWLQIFIAMLTLSGLYIIMTRWLREVYDVIILSILWAMIIWSNYFIFSNSMTLSFESPLMSALLWAMSLFTFFFAQILVSRWTWMGGWDLRIALMAGFIVGIYFTFPAWFLTYITWSIIGILMILFSKAQHRLKESFQHQIPFWPFIAAWYLGVMFFHPYISKILTLYF